MHLTSSQGSIFTEYIISNALFQERLIQACARQKVKKLILVSGTNILLPNKNGLVDSTSQYNLNTKSMYLNSKIYAELIAQSVRDLDIKLQTIRLSSLYGPKMSHGLIHAFISKLIRGEHIEIQGSGEWSSDLLWVEDAAEIICHAASNNCINTQNIGTGALTSVKAIASMLASELNQPASLIQYKTNPDQKNNKGFSAVDPKACESILKRKPLDVDGGIKEIIKFYQ